MENGTVTAREPDGHYTPTTKYRTQEQFEHIVNNVLNGNRTDAGQKCVDCGFYANDLLKANGNNDERDDIGAMALYDMVLLVEIAERIRNRGINEPQGLYKQHEK